MVENNKTPYEFTNYIVNTLKLSPSNTAILCVDCQNGFTERCSNELPVVGTNEEWIDQVNEFLTLMKERNFKIFASMDDHPENHISFEKWPPHCIKGTYGNQLFINTYDFVIKKGEEVDGDSYSAFYKDSERRIESELDELLRKHKIENLVVLGLAGDVCVIATIEDALKRGHRIFPVSQYIKAVNKKDIKEIVEEKFGRIII